MIICLLDGCSPVLRRAGFACAAFVGSFLLFLVQPLAAKALLPGFGGSFMVWTVTLTFFQGTLFAGYLLAHLLFGSKVSSSRTLFYLGAALGTLVLFRFGPESLAAGPGTSHFMTAILGLLFSAVGAPAIMLAAGTITLQRWWQVTPGLAVETASSLYAASNAGSLFALLAFPLLLEPSYDLATIANGWAFLYIFWIALLLLSAPWKPAREVSWEELVAHPSPIPATSQTPPPSGAHDQNAFADLYALAFSPDIEAAAAFSPVMGNLWQTGHWFIAAAAGSALLSATTNILTLDLASMPLLWVLPLAIYLISWIRAFAPRKRSAEQEPPPIGRWFAAGSCLFFLTGLGFSLGAIVLLIGFLLIQYKISVRVHQSLAESAPGETHLLSRFYLVIAAGGWAGSVLVSLFVPMLQSGLIEYPLALLLAASAVWQESARLNDADPSVLVRTAGVALFVFLLPLLAVKGLPLTGTLLVAAAGGACVYIFICFREAENRGMHRLVTAGAVVFCLLWLDAWGAPGRQLERNRTWYGLYRVFEQDSLRSIEMGSTLHGCESFRPADNGKPVLYYHPETPIAGLLSSTTASTAERIAVIGLGAGTLAAFGRSGQGYDFYELDPFGEGLARRWFSYLGSSPATIRVIAGDGRLMLRQATSTYDLIIFDAFNSDAIPVHLLTREALAEYRSRLSPDGILVFHLSNRHLNLAPILVGAATDSGLEVRLAANRPSPEGTTTASATEPANSPDTQPSPRTMPAGSSRESRIEALLRGIGIGILGSAAADLDDRKPTPAIPTRWLVAGTMAGLTKHLGSLPAWQPPETFASSTPRFWSDRASSLFPLLLKGPWDPESARGLVCNEPAKGR